MSACWFDSHCHFDFPVFDPERLSIWAHCQQLNLGGLIIPGVSRQQSRLAQALIVDQPWFLAYGLHPYFLEQHQPADWHWLENQMIVPSEPALQPVAVGEFGLHLTKATTATERTHQQSLFEYQVTLARDCHLPVILHGVGAHDLIASTLKRLKCQSGGVVHAFSGSYQQAKRYLDLGLRLGIGATFFHPGAHKLRRTIAALPRDGVLIETDAPDMAAPFWNRQHGLYSPQAVPVIGAGLAAIWKMPMDELRSQLWLNLLHSFPRLAER